MKKRLIIFLILLLFLNLYSCNKPSLIDREDWIGYLDDGRETEFISCENGGAIQGKVFDLNNIIHNKDNSAKLPNFDNLTPVDTVCVNKFNVPARSFDQGFPEVENLFEWFGIKFETTLEIFEPGYYVFYLTSDDGAILKIDGKEVINNDGVHKPEMKDNENSPIYLAIGAHSLRMDYFQGPRYQIALQLEWLTPEGRQIVPSGAFSGK